MFIAFPLTLTNECKHVMNPYYEIKVLFFASASNSLGKASQCAQLKTNYLSVRFKVDRITQAYTRQNLNEKSCKRFLSSSYFSFLIPKCFTFKFEIFTILNNVFFFGSHFEFIVLYGRTFKTHFFHFYLHPNIINICLNINFVVIFIKIQVTQIVFHFHMY